MGNGFGQAHQSMQVGSTPLQTPCVAYGFADVEAVFARGSQS